MISESLNRPPKRNITKEKRASYQKDYRETCGDVVREQIKEWFKEHPKYLKKWRSDHPRYFDAWRQKNKNKLREYKRLYMREYRRILKLKASYM
jgi:hypothetical protein